MFVDLETRLAAPAERVIAAVRTTRLLRHVAAPLLRFSPIEPKSLPEIWGEGRYRVFMWVFGFIPFGRQWIVVSEWTEDGENGGTVFRIRDNGSGDVVRVWDHHIFISAAGAGETIYRDRVEVKAGLLTPLVWLFAAVFYRHRQARWRRLVRRDFRY